MKKINHNSLCETETFKGGMTDNDIIKALECCGVNRDCVGCPKEKEPYGCYFVLCGGALDLINRKDAEIEKLNVELVGMRGACESYKMHYDKAQTEIERLDKLVIYNASCCTRLHKDLFNAKSEAIKEFAERLKKEIAHIPAWGRVAEKKIDNLVKEMTENDFKE